MSLRLKIPSYNLIGFTRRNPHVSILDWCNFDFDFYQLDTAKPSELRPATKTFLELRKKRRMILQRKINIGTNSSVFVFKCNHRKRGSIEDIMHRFGCLPIPPLVFREGWLRITALCFEEDRMATMLSHLSRFGELVIDEKAKMDPELLRKNFMIPTSALVSTLTAKQAESLLAAVEHGYYQVPRETKFDDISNKLRIPRTTYEEHVRKAESKVINAVAPYLSLYFGRTPQSGTSAIHCPPRTKSVPVKTLHLLGQIGLENEEAKQFLSSSKFNGRPRVFR